MSLLFTNNAKSTLASGISAAAGSLTVQAGDGAKFPSPAGGDSFLVTLEDASNNIEIVECTSRSGDVLTINRNQEGSGAKAYLAGDSVALRITAGVLSQYRQGVGDAVTDTAINLAIGAGNVHDFINCTAALTITLADAATMAAGYQVTIKNQGTGNVTVNRATGADTIDGVVQDLTLPPNASVYLSVNAAENGYITMFNGAPAAYPIGAVFFSAVATNPSDLLGFGTWAAVPGRFVVGVGDNGDGKNYTLLTTGGQKDQSIIDHDHTITDPGHTHGASGARENGNVGSRFGITSRAQEAVPVTNSATTNITVDNVDPAGVAVAEDIQASGNDLNLPPWIGLHIWRRTA